MTDPYQCAVCLTRWPVRILATECCTPERAERRRALADLAADITRDTPPDRVIQTR